jgi:hypothetical protein
MIKNRALVLFFCVLFASSLWAETTLCYRVKVEGKTSTLERKVERTEYGFHVVDGKSSYELDRQYSTLRWESEDPATNTAIRAEKFGETIIVSGTVHGKPMDMRFETKGLPWYECWQVSLTGLIHSKKRRLSFFTIRPDLKEFVMEASREPAQTVSVGDTQAQAVKVTVNPAGVPALFWSARLWFDPDAEPVLLRYECPTGGPGAPLMVEELSTRM